MSTIKPARQVTFHNQKRYIFFFVHSTWMTDWTRKWELFDEMRLRVGQIENRWDETVFVKIWTDKTGSLWSAAVSDEDRKCVVEHTNQSAKCLQDELQRAWIRGWIKSVSSSAARPPARAPHRCTFFQKNSLHMFLHGHTPPHTKSCIRDEINFFFFFLPQWLQHLPTTSVGTARIPIRCKSTAQPFTD